MDLATIEYMTLNVNSGAPALARDAAVHGAEDQDRGRSTAHHRQVSRTCQGMESPPPQKKTQFQYTWGWFGAG